MQVIDASGCTSTIATTIITQPNALACVVATTNITCNGGNNGIFSCTASGGKTTYQYSDNGGATYQPSNVFSNLALGTYTVKIKDANGCLSSGSIKTITQPAAITFTTAVVNSSHCNTSTGQIIIYATGGSGVYNFSKNAGTTWQSGYTFSSLAPGTYAMKVKDANGCMSFTTNAIVGCSAREEFTSVSSTNSSSFNVYPNPTKDEVTIVFSSDKEEEYSICLVDVTGRVIRCNKDNTVIGDNQYQMNLSEVAKGIYFIILQKGDATLQKKIVVQ
jgi:hypothetical protein